MHLRKHPEFAACISTEAQLAVFTAGPRDSKAQKLALHKVFESFMARSSEELQAPFNLGRRCVWASILGRADRSEVVSEFQPKPGPRCRPLPLGEK